MDRLKLYPRQHVSVNDFAQLQLDTIEEFRKHIEEFHNPSSKYILTTTIFGSGSMDINETILASLTVNVSAGVGILNGDRVNIQEVTTYTITNIPSGTLLSHQIVRVDLLGVQYAEVLTDNYVLDFMDTDGNIYQEEVPTRILESYEFVQIAGGPTTANKANNYAGRELGRPTVPSGVLPLVWLNLKNQTTAMYKYPGHTDLQDLALTEGFFEDARPLWFT